VDLGVDWRESEPTDLAVGPVLSLEDAVGNKMLALFGRAEARDFLDVDAFRRSGRFTDDDLLRAAAERDRGFDTIMFAEQLDLVHRVGVDEVSGYGVDADQLEALKGRFMAWARQLRSSPANPG
jgi:Nucleotidyl transferase AbiEii toxin, Type IV TA system